MPNFEATLFNTLKDLASVTKVNMVQTLNTAIADGTVTMDEKTLHTVTNIFSATIDGSLDMTHVQLLKVAGPNTKKKTTK